MVKFDDMSGSPYASIVLNTVLVYVFILLAIRLFGKKELSQLSVADLVLILLISNSVQNAMVAGDNTLLGGLLAALVLFVLNYLFKLIMFNSTRVKELIEGEPVLLVYKGNVHSRNMEKEKITMDELEAVVREHGVGKIEDVVLSMLEVDGNISVLSKSIAGQSFHKRQHKQLHPKYKKN
jgi:uncharacterized membrane protein YcaP (DUF421 family)